ncbi:replicative DNA helicase [Methylobacterium segetis]|uniref:replicative DNA helicase n=1 Tax=Methylobacterium segetis TaxID=2488750 RepID=UPI001FE1D9E5|nr:DnaB-like helicase C-terminal domain-containing protein [Methylobacterium segetis]
MSNAVVPFRQQQPESEPPPHSMEVEQALLGALMWRNAAMAEVAPIVEADHFFFGEHKEIYASIANLIAQGVEANPISVKAYLARPEISGQPAMQYLAHVYGSAATTNAKGYAIIVRDLFVRRKLVVIAEDLIQRARHDPLEASGATVIDDAVADLLLARADLPDEEKTSFTAAQGSSWLIDRVEQIRSGALKSSAIPTGIADLDRATNGGFQRGQLYLIAGRPGMGKTVAFTSLSRNAARDHGVLAFQLEVTRDQQFARYHADLAYVHNRPLTFGQIMAGKVDDEDMWRLEDASKRFGRLHLTVDCRPSVSVSQILYAVKAEKKRLAALGVSLGTIFIDYLKFVKVSDRYKGQRVLEIGEITGSLKQLAKAEDVCVVLLTQLSRQTEARERENKRPVLGDLRDSGELEQDADTVLFLYREAYYLKNKLEGASDPEAKERLANQLFEQQHALELILGKNRAGPCSTLNLWCDVAASSMAQVARMPM